MAGVPAVVEMGVEPVPLAAMPIEVEGIAVAVRVQELGASIEVDPIELLPLLRDEALVLEEEPADGGRQADRPLLHQTSARRLARGVRLALAQHRHRADAGEVDLLAGRDGRLAARGAELPTLADELGGVEVLRFDGLTD